MNGAGATIADADAHGSITSDDRYALSVDSPSVVEGGPGSTTDLEFTVRLSEAAAFEVLVDTTIGGTATAGDDYTGLAAGKLRFAAGETAKTLTATVTGDDDVERDETVEVRASLAPGYDRTIWGRARRQPARPARAPSAPTNTSSISAKVRMGTRTTRPTATCRSASRWSCIRPCPSR